MTQINKKLYIFIFLIILLIILAIFSAFGYAAISKYINTKPLESASISESLYFGETIENDMKKKTK